VTLHFCFLIIFELWYVERKWWQHCNNRVWILHVCCIILSLQLQPRSHRLECVQMIWLHVQKFVSTGNMKGVITRSKSVGMEQNNQSRLCSTYSKYIIHQAFIIGTVFMSTLSHMRHYLLQDSCVAKIDSDHRLNFCGQPLMLRQGWLNHTIFVLQIQQISICSCHCIK
jgi:hypothetical protein